LSVEPLVTGTGLRQYQDHGIDAPSLDWISWQMNPKLTLALPGRRFITPRDPRATWRRSARAGCAND